MMGTLLALGAVVISVGCQHVFDGLRLADYAILGGLAALFAPGLEARWSSRPLLLGVALLVIVAGGLRLSSSYDRLFDYTEGHVAAARWAAESTPADATFASDTRMSLLLLGAARRNATFEGTDWLFDGSPLASRIRALNANARFVDRPIRYVLLSDALRDTGAEVAWFTPTVKPPPSLEPRLDGLGQRVYNRGGVTVWELDRAALVEASMIEPAIPETGAGVGILARIFGIRPARCAGSQDGVSPTDRRGGPRGGPCSGAPVRRWAPAAQPVHRDAGRLRLPHAPRTGRTP